MTIAVMQPYIFPYIGYFQMIKAADVFVFYDDGLLSINQELQGEFEEDVSFNWFTFSQKSINPQKAKS